MSKPTEVLLNLYASKYRRPMETRCRAYTVGGGLVVLYEDTDVDIVDKLTMTQVLYCLRLLKDPVRPNEADLRAFGEEQGFLWDEGRGYDLLVHFMHKDKVIVNPYSYTMGDPADIFGQEKMAEWIAQARAVMAGLETSSLPAE